MTEGALLDSAKAIADRLCDEALWSERRALWVGDERANPTGEWETVHRSLGGDIYGGSAGIAIFLARIWELSHDERHRATAVGALRHAISWVERSRPAASLYDGASGVAAALCEAAVTFGDDRLAAEARDVTLASLERLPRQSDLISGRAGAIIALLWAAETLGIAPAIDGAQQLGRELAVDGVHGIDGSASWASDIDDSEPPLCGLAHGASGIALALSILSKIDGEEALLELAAEAAMSERRWFDREQSNWPDLRELTRSRVARGDRPPSPVFWCHGAVGIGLVRLHQFETTGETIFAVEAEAALHAAERALAEMAQAGAIADASICHGAGGIAELFLEGARVLGQPELRKLAVECCEMVAAAGAGGSWPSGVPGGGENPSLMLGLAGTGLMFLRCANPSVAPVGLLYAPWRVSQRIIVQLRGSPDLDRLHRRAEELRDLVSASRVERISKRGRILLRVADDAATASAVAVLGKLDDVDYAEPDVIDRAQ